MNSAKLKQVVLWVLAAGFPLMYVGAVSLQNTALTIAALIAAGVAAVAAAVVY